MSELPATIHWQGPHALWASADAKSIFDNDALQGPGVCLWTVDRGGRHHVMFVEMSDNLGARFHEHLTNYLTGHYFIYDVDDLVAGKQRVVYEPVSWSELVRDYLNFATPMHRMLSTLRFFVAPLDYDDTTLHRVESGVMHSLWDHSDEAKEFLLNDRPTIMMTEQQKISMPIQCDGSIEGLSDSLKI